MKILRLKVIFKQSWKKESKNPAKRMHFKWSVFFLFASKKSEFLICNWKVLEFLRNTMFIVSSVCQISLQYSVDFFFLFLKHLKLSGNFILLLEWQPWLMWVMYILIRSLYKNIAIFQSPENIWLSPMFGTIIPQGKCPGVKPSFFDFVCYHIKFWILKCVVKLSKFISCLISGPK